MRLSTPKWQNILSQGFKSQSDLLEYLGLPSSLGSQEAEQAFATRIPQGYAARMSRENPHDPLLLQVLASSSETIITPGFSKDPLDESAYNPIPGLIHKYPNRVLLTLTGACAVNCRYCFRRYFPYQENNPGQAGWDEALKYISSHPEISEVILSGGDPLIAPDKRLALLFNSLSNMAHVTTLRIHTRMPIVLPERVDDNLISLLNKLSLQKVIVFHINHPQEIDESVEAMCKRLKEVGVTLLNQSVLLKGINDDSDVLASLSNRLFSCQILPYYLHLLDKVQGAAHFEVPLESAQKIYKSLQTKVSGYLVPKLAVENPGELHKTLLI